MHRLQTGASGGKWRQGTATPQQYTFAYDSLNRLKTATYAGNGAFNAAYNYDANGNLATLARKLAGNEIDNLTYNYTANTNKLASVTDAAPAAYKNEGYRPGATSFAYDANGNMTTDQDGVNISYNYLNLPEQVTNIDQGIGYSYTANGQKLQKVVDAATQGNKVVDYIGPFLYEDGDLKVIFTSSGRMVKVVDGNNTVWKHEYSLTDHLGNVRTVFAAHGNGIPELMQQTDYYPFGMVMQQQEYFKLEEVKNRYLYNGKELQDDDIGVVLGWYDYGARFYDPALARFHTVDPLADKYPELSPYAYVHNNPILLKDPTGMSATKFEDEEGNLLYETKDNIDATVVVSNDKIENFQKDINQLGDNTLTSPQTEKQKTIDLSSKYIQEGKMFSYTLDKAGNIRNLTFGTAPKNTVHQIGLRATGAVGPAGVTFAGGVAWDSKGNVGLYGSVGGAIGFDGSFGVEYTENSSFSSDLNITSLRGPSQDTNGSISILDISNGGNVTNTQTPFSQTGSLYKSTTVGISASPYLLGGSRTYEVMGVVPIRYK